MTTTPEAREFGMPLRKLIEKLQKIEEKQLLPVVALDSTATIYHPDDDGGRFPELKGATILTIRLVNHPDSVLKQPGERCDKCGPFDSVCQPHSYCPCYRVPMVARVMRGAKGDV